MRSRADVGRSRARRVVCLLRLCAEVARISGMGRIRERGAEGGGSRAERGGRGVREYLGWRRRRRNSRQQVLDL